MHRHQRTHGMKAPSDTETENKSVPECKQINQARKRAFSNGNNNGGQEMDMPSNGTNNNQNMKEIFTSQSVSCPVCKETFINDISVETHILSVHPGQHLKCDSCTAMYPTFQNLKLHKYLHHLSSLPNYSAGSNPFNPSMFMPTPEKNSLKIPFHEQIHDDSDDNKSFVSSSPIPTKSQLEGALTRPLNKDKDLADIPSIITMAQNFTGIPKEEISLRISKSPSLTSVTPENDISVSINDDDDMNSAKKMRFDDDPIFDDDPVIKEMKLKGEFPCSLCPSVFPNLRALKGHNKEHLGKAPYRCNVGTCTYTSNDKSTLTRHMRRHTGEKPFECKICNFGFTTKANCERHLKNKHQKTTRDQIRESVIIHETEDTETMISRMQMSGDVTIHNQSPLGNNMRSEADLAFRCKVCKFTFMSKFAAIQHGIHTHPEYAENIDEIAEPVGIGSPRKTDTSPEIIEIVSSGKARNKIKNMTGFYPNNADHEVPNNDMEEDAPLDLSQSNANEDGLDLSYRKNGVDCEEDNKQNKDGITIPTPIFPPSLPYFMPGLTNQHPLALMMPQLFGQHLMMPQLFGQQIDKDAQEKIQKEIMQRLQLQSRSSYFNPSLPIGPMDIASLMAAQDAARKQTEMKQQQEAAETLQKLSQMQVIPSQTLKTTTLSEEGKYDGTSDSNKKDHESSFKMVMKNGVLMKKQKQRRYRTERPYSCQSCTARFTLRSNMERHIKQQHPETWGDKLKGARRSFNNVAMPQISPDLKEHFHDMDITRGEEADAEKDNDNEEEGELIIDDQPEEGDEDKPPADLASISNLLNTANNHTFNQYFNNSQDEDSNHVREHDDSNSENESKDTEQKKSAYSSAPHKISCPFCSRKFPWESSLKRHILTHTGQKPFKCRDCPLWFTTKSNCDRHQMRKHGENAENIYNSRNVPDRPYKCSLCPSSTFSSESNLRLHQCTKHLSMDCRNGADENTENEELEDDAEDNVGIVSSYFKCHLCDEDFIHRDHVIAHIEHEHQEAYNEEKEVYESAIRMSTENKKNNPNPETIKDDEMCRRVNCIFCPCQFVSTNELRKHILLHVNNKPFACDICNKKFTIKQALMRHKKKHDSGVSSEEENSEEDLPHYRIAMPSQVKHFSVENERGESDLKIIVSKEANDNVNGMNTEKLSETNILSELSSVSKRANLMDTINKLSAAKADIADKKSTLDQLFGNPSIAQR